MKVMLVDKREVFREGIAKILESIPKYSAVITCSNANEAFEKAQGVEPDIIIIDMDMKDKNYPEFIKRLKNLVPTSKIAILSDSENEFDLFSTIRAGANAYLSKDIKIAELTNNIDRILDGETVISQPMFSKLLGEFILLEEKKDMAGKKDKFGLSDREKEVLALIVHGVSNKKVAQSLCVSENTVRVHLHKIMRKLRVHNRLEAAILALQNKVVEL